MGEWKIYAAIGLVLGLLAGVLAYGHHEYALGSDSVQDQWDKASAATAEASAQQAYAALQTQSAQSSAFAAIDADYHKALTNEPTTPIPSAAAVRSGSVQLRDVWQCPAISTAYLPQAAAGAGGGDGAQSGAIEQRAEGAASLIRYADSADQREREYAAKVTALQQIIQAERAGQQ